MSKAANLEDHELAIGTGESSTLISFMEVGQLESRTEGETEEVRGFDGTVELAKSDATDVEGTIDLEKDGVSVKGTFKATKRP